MTEFNVRPIGRVESPLTDPSTAPEQGDLGAGDGIPVIDVKPVLGERGER